MKIFICGSMYFAKEMLEAKKKLKIIYRESSLPEEEKKRRLFEALKMLINEEDLLKYSRLKKKSI